mgnify:CR=1 FL=1
MRRLFSLILLMICTMPVWADNLDQLYKAAGWPDQRAHFNDALSAAQERYRNSLPPAVYQALVNNSNQRFQAQAVDRRAQAQLRRQGGCQALSTHRRERQAPPFQTACAAQGGLPFGPGVERAAPALLPPPLRAWATRHQKDRLACAVNQPWGRGRAA